MRLINWKATPSGGRIVINGTDERTMRDAKVRGVRSIDREPYGLFRSRVVARDAAGDYLATLA